MIWLIGMASNLLIAYALCVVGLEDTPFTIFCRIVLVLVANVMLWFANDRYEKLKSRIKVLEDKVENNEAYIHKLSKKLSDKTIEYYTDEE